MEMIILIGLQASGKSTFFRTHFAETHEHISKELLRNTKNPRMRQAQLVEVALEAKRSVVIDNTNPTVEERESLILLGTLMELKSLDIISSRRLASALSATSSVRAKQGCQTWQFM